MRFQGQAGLTVKFSMWNTNSSGLSSRLILSRPGGAVLARSLGIGDAYIEDSLPANATYTIEATRTSGSTSGAYSLSLTCETPEVADDDTDELKAVDDTSDERRTSDSGIIIVVGNCNLREAIESANRDRAVGGCRAGSGADVIELRVDVTLNSPLRITSSITIEGGGREISGGGKSRIFHVEASGALTLRNAHLLDGGGNPAIRPANTDWIRQKRGGAIFNEGALSIINCRFSDNSTEWGGVIFNLGEASISGSSFSGNSADDGGAILNYGETTVSRSSFSENSADNNGGAILNQDDGSGHSFSVTVSDSSFPGNSATSRGGAIWNKGEASLSGNTFADNSPNDCEGLRCVSVPGGGPKTEDDAGNTESVTVPADTADPGGSDPSPALSHNELVAVEDLACTTNDIYAIIRLKTDTPVREHLFEIRVSNAGDAVLADILPMPKVKSLPERLVSVVTLSLAAEGVGAAVQATTGFPLAGTAFKAGAEIGEWIDEQFTSSSSPLHFRLTWYNTDVHPGIERYLLHAKRTGADGGGLRLATRLAPLSDAAKWTRDKVNQDTYSTQIKNAIDVALYWMGKDPGGFGTGSELGDKVIDWIAAPAEWLLDEVVTGPVAYWAERFFTESGVTTAPVEIY